VLRLGICVVDNAAICAEVNAPACKAEMSANSVVVSDATWDVVSAAISDVVEDVVIAIF
jgi:hypothetical protein